MSRDSRQSFGIVSVNHTEVKIIREPWISPDSIDIMEKRKMIPAGNSYRAERKILKNKLTKSLRRDREKALINKAKEMEKAFATGNMRLLFSLSRNSSRSNIVIETICEKDGTLIRNQDRRIDRWAEHFSEQFSWPNTDLPNVADMTVRTAYAISDEAPTRDEISTELRCLKSNKASGPDNLSSQLFKEGG